MWAVCGATEPDCVGLSLVGTLMYVGAIFAVVNSANVQARAVRWCPRGLNPSMSDRMRRIEGVAGEQIAKRERFVL